MSDTIPKHELELLRGIDPLHTERRAAVLEQTHQDALLEDIISDPTRAPLFTSSARDTRLAAALRRGNRSRYRHLIAVGVVLAVAATGAAAAVISLAEGSSPPVRLPGGSGLCPLGYPYAAEADQRLVYPPNYPGRPAASAHVTSCFDSAQDARNAGYRIPPPPAGDTTLGPLYIASTPPAVRRECRGAQRQTHAAIYCPSRLPTQWLTGANPDCPSAGCFAPLLSITGSFADPSSTSPPSPGESNASIWAASASQLRHYPVPIGCGAARPNYDARLISRTSFRGHKAAWYECTGGEPLMLEWHLGQESYGITADDSGGLRRRLIEYIAAHLVSERQPR